MTNIPLNRRIVDCVRRLRSSRLLAQWAKDRRASVLPLIAVCGLVLTGVTGLALDGARMAIMSSRLQAAVDAAGLSAGARVSTEAFAGEVERFARANFADGYVNAAITSINSRQGRDEDTFIVTASARAETIFMRIFGLDDFNVSAEAEITRAMGGLELALVLDVTGSMDLVDSRGRRRIDGLKAASNDLLDILFGDDTTVDQLHVGIVPFSQAVNIGKSHNSWLTATPANSWGGCVEERFNGRDVTDSPPSSEKFRPVAMTYCPPTFTPLTSSKIVLRTAVSNLNAIGGTFVNVGAVWGWRMLSPRWRGSWGTAMASNLPLDYNVKDMTKAVVIMTDGENQYNTGGAYGGMNCTGRTGAYSCSTDSRLNTTDWSYYNLTGVRDYPIGPNSHAKLDAKFSAVCTSMKNAGIIIYTVAFGSPGSAIESRLRSCATQPAFYFDSPSGADLQTAFARIGDSLAALRVSR